MKSSVITLVVCLSTYWSLYAQNVITLPKWDVKPQELTQLNSPQRDVNLSITPNGKYLYFMTGRGQMPWSNTRYTMFRGKWEGDGDIWYSKRVDGAWQKPVCIGQPVCTNMGEDEPNISADGQTVYFQSWKSSWATTGGPYYKAELRGDQWGTPKGLGGGIGRFFRGNGFATDGMSVSSNGKIFVVAAGPDYDGPMDIYISRKNNQGEWLDLKKLDICTEKDERSVFIGADNRTLYFGSAGWGGFGNLDIFKTTLEEGTACGQVINIGKPFNTKQNDYGFVMDAIRNEVYFVRDGDIFYAKLGEDVDERIKPNPVVVIDGFVKDSTGKPQEAEIEVIQNKTAKTVAEARSNKLTGEYSLSIPKVEGQYTQQATFNDQYVVEQNIEIDQDTEPLIELSVIVDPKKLEIPYQTPEKTRVETPEMVTRSEPSKQELTKIVYFEFAESNLTQDAKNALREIVNQLSNASEIEWELIGHTDAIGSDTYNISLARARAYNVSKFLKSLNVKQEMEIQVKGEKEPAVANDTDEHRAENRRVEIRVKYEL